MTFVTDFKRLDGLVYLSLIVIVAVWFFMIWFVLPSQEDRDRAKQVREQEYQVMYQAVKTRCRNACVARDMVGSDAQRGLCRCYVPSEKRVVTLWDSRRAYHE